MQLEVVNNISLYSDLKALCLVSKSFYDIATPRIYYKVDIRPEYLHSTRMKYDDDYDCHMLLKIRSLLVQPGNLRYVRVLKTGRSGMQSTMLMDKLLPLLPKDSLIKFSYDTRSSGDFPTPLQLEFLWDRQKNLQNLKLLPQMVPWLEERLQERKPSQNALLKSFTKVDIGGYSESRFSPYVNTWPLKNLDLSLLQSLSLDSILHERDFPAAIDLFTGLSFVNLTKLILKGIIFAKTVKFPNMPNLKSLNMNQCEDAIAVANGQWTVRLPFEFPDNFHLQSLTYWGYGKAEPLTHLLTQVKGLKKLVVGVKHRQHCHHQAITDFTSAVMLHNDTLRLFDFIGPFRDYTTLSQLFPRLRLENLPNIYYGAWRMAPHYYVIFRLSALAEQSGSCKDIDEELMKKFDGK